MPILRDTGEDPTNPKNARNQIVRERESGKNIHRMRSKIDREHSHIQRVCRYPANWKGSEEKSYVRINVHLLVGTRCKVSLHCVYE